LRGSAAGFVRAGPAGVVRGVTGRARGVGLGCSRVVWCGSVIPIARYGCSTASGRRTPATARPPGTRSVAAITAGSARQRRRREGRATGSAPAVAVAMIALTCRLAVTSSSGRT